MKDGSRNLAEDAIHPRPERRGFPRIQVILEDILQGVAPGKSCPRQGLHPARDYALNGG